MSSDVLVQGVLGPDLPRDRAHQPPKNEPDKEQQLKVWLLLLSAPGVASSRIRDGFLLRCGRMPLGIIGFHKLAVL